MTRAQITRGGKILREHRGSVASLGMNPWSLHRNRNIAALLSREPYYAEFLRARERPWWSQEPAPLTYRGPIDLIEQLDIKAGVVRIPKFDKHTLLAEHIAYARQLQALELGARGLLDILEADLDRPFVRLLEQLRKERDGGY